MDWQQVMALVIVAVTAGLFAWSRLRRRSGLKSHHPCGCGHGDHHGEKSSVVFRARKGKRPEIIVRMK